MDWSESCGGRGSNGLRGCCCVHRDRPSPRHTSPLLSLPNIPRPPHMHASTMMLLQNHRIAHVHAPSRKRKLAPAAPASTAALVTHHDSHSHHHNACAAPKRVRQWNEIEYEEMLLEATLLREELELLVAVALDLCKDLGIDVRNVLRFAAELRQVEALLMQPEGMTVDRIRMACQQMLSMCQYLCQHHNDHFLLIEMHDELRVSRNRCMRFVCQYGAKLGLYC